MTTSNEKSYFDLHITGLGYLNRIREVKPKKGDAFLACDIAALNGPSDDVSYVRFDTRVSGSEAQHLVRRCIQAVDAEKKVMIGRSEEHTSELQSPMRISYAVVCWKKKQTRKNYQSEIRQTD